jgi:hypothetical protein
VNLQWLCHPAIVWKRGPFPASKHVITIFQGAKSDVHKDTWDRTSLYFATKKVLSNELGEDARGIGESGYTGEPEFIIVSHEGQSKECCEFSAQSKNHKETLRSSIKSWNILKRNFCHRHGQMGREEDGVVWLCHDNNSCNNTVQL